MTTAITIGHEQVEALAAFLRKHGKSEFFLAKDQGAYIGATGGDRDAGTFENCIFYFDGMDPNRERYAGEAWDNARAAFGGDDFGEHLSAAPLFELADVPGFDKTFTVTVSDVAIEVGGAFRPARAS